MRDRTFVSAQIKEKNDNDKISTFYSPLLIQFAINDYTF